MRSRSPVDPSRWLLACLVPLALTAGCGNSGGDGGDGGVLDGAPPADADVPADADLGETPPANIASDPGFEDELAEIGWHPFEPADGLADIEGDGLPPTDDDALGPVDGAPGIAFDEWGGVVGTGLEATATGYFHVERPAGAERAWLIDPAGNPFYAVSVNSVLRTGGVPDIEPYLLRFDDMDEVAAAEWNRLSVGEGDGYGYRFNSTLGFSNRSDFGAPYNPILDHAPHGINLSISAPSGADYAMRDASGEVFVGGTPLGDPYNPAYRDALIEKWVPMVRPTDPKLITYYLGNEVGLFDWPQHIEGKPPGHRDLRPYIWGHCPAASTIDAPQCASHALVHYLRDRHGDIATLNAAWGSSFADFDDILEVRPSPDATGARACTGECEQDMQRFQRKLWRQYIKLWTKTLRELDPNHLIASPRLAVVNPRYYCFWGLPGCVAYFNDGRKVGAGTGVTYSPWRLFRRNGPYGFDLVAVNAYSQPRERAYEEPWFRRGLHKIMRESKLPILITEFGVRSRIDGWTNSGGAGSFVPDGTTEEEQKTRGLYYRYDMSRFATFRGVLGASIHRWADRYDDTNQMNMGIIHRDGARWDVFDAHIRAWNGTVYSRLHHLTGF